MLTPDRMTESEALAAYVDEQIGAILTAAHGLTEEQARQRPCRSELSIGGLLKHATFVLDGHAEPRGRTADGGTAITPEAFAAFAGSFALTAEETIEGAREALRAARSATRERIAGADPGAPALAPPAPWHGRFESTPITARFMTLHLVEELARHAGHADIIREQIDGAGAGPLMLAEEGLPGNDFMDPWTPEETQGVGASESV